MNSKTFMFMPNVAHCIELMRILKSNYYDGSFSANFNFNREGKECHSLKKRIIITLLYLLNFILSIFREKDETFISAAQNPQGSDRGQKHIVV